MRMPSLTIAVACRVLCLGAMLMPLGTAAAPETGTITPLSSINNSMASQEVAVRGKVSSYRAPTSDRAPHSVMLKDDSGTMRVVIWQRDWEKIPFRDEIQPGATLTAKLRVTEYRGSMELHLEAANRIRKGSADPGEIVGAGGARMASTSGASIPARKIEWGSDLTAAMEQAKRDGKKIMVFFHAPEAEPSKFAQSHVFADSRVIEEVVGLYVPVMVDLSKQRELATRLGVFRGGVVGLYRADGSAIKQIQTVRSRTDFLNEIR